MHTQHIFFIHSSNDGPFSWLQILAIMNSAALSMMVQVSLWYNMFMTFVYILNNASYTSLFLVLLISFVPRWLYISTKRVQTVPFPFILASICYSVLDFSHSKNVWDNISLWFYFAYPRFIWLQWFITDFVSIHYWAI